MSRAPSLQDVANAAGVSMATASLALRDKGRISAEVRLRIKAVAGEIGYVPNPIARSLVGGRTGLIAVAMPGLAVAPEVIGSVDYYFRLLGAAAAEAFDSGYGLLLLPPGEGQKGVSVDGVVVVDPAAGDHTVTSFDLRGQPVITVGQRVDHTETDSVRMLSVDIDAPLATKRMLDHLADRGADRVDLFATEPIDSFERDSIEAYRAWCADRSLEPRITLSESLGNEDVDRSTALILNQVERPDAIYATIDELALVLLDHCHSRGVEVPADLLIGTAGDGERTRNASPPLTVLDDRPAELGAVAARTLIEAIENPGDGPVELLVETDVLIRASTTPQRGSSA